jgi:hypothetical protein
MLNCKDELVNIGYMQNEPSISYLAYCYYRKHFSEAEAKSKADKYCEKLQELIRAEK